LLKFARNLFSRGDAHTGLSFSRPLVILQSDDWGRVGVRDRDGFEFLRGRGLRLGEHPYDLYSLEKADDVSALAALLATHHDSSGRPPCVVMNFCTANLDFKKMRQQSFQKIELLPLSRGLPGGWSRPGLIEAYRAGVQKGVFHPALHGLQHFSTVAVENALAENGERAKLLRLMWEAETPSIYWRMPWIGFEYWNPEKPNAGFLPLERQRNMILQASENLYAMFGTHATSACAPGYRANDDTHLCLHEAGIRVAQNGTGSGLKAPHVDELGILHVYRNIDFEPSQREQDNDRYLKIAGACFSHGIPVVISIHSINFHSSLKDFRTSSLAALDSLLSDLEKKFPELLYVHDQDLHAIATEGTFRNRHEKITVAATRREWKTSIAHQGAM